MGRVSILVASIYRETVEAFVQSVCEHFEDGVGTTILEGAKVELRILAGDPRLNPAWEETVGQADGLILLTRFLDVISLDKIKAIYRAMPSEQQIPSTVVLFREEGEVEFKMSCPACGQKLWIRDQDVNKRGRCPNCKRAFKLPSQAGHLRSQLMLTDSIPVLSVVKDNKESCRGAVASLAGRLIAHVSSEDHEEAIKNATVRVQI